jgi:hypothetical protein
MRKWETGIRKNIRFIVPEHSRKQSMWWNTPVPPVPEFLTQCCIFTAPEMDAVRTVKEITWNK